MDNDRARRLVRLHAATSRLLGVDFVPSYRSSARPAGVELEAKPAPAEAGSAPRATLMSAQGGADDDASPATGPERAAGRTAEADGHGADAERASAGEALEALRRRYEREAPHASFDTTFTNIVFGEGDPRARLVFIGEAPGEDEDLTGRPFVGRAGQLLDKMIVAMGLRREQVYICNVLKTRPPGNRTPTPAETLACKPYLLEQLSIVRPDAAVLLGACATHAVLDTTDPIGRLRGRWWSFRDARGREVPAMPTYHPAYLLRSYTEENRLKVWSDLKAAMTRLGISPVAKGS